MTISTDSDAADHAAASATGTGAATGRNRLTWLLVAAALVVGTALGLGIGLVVPHLRTPGDDSVEAGFLRDMAVHHAQAVEMSMIVHQKSDNPEIVYLANDIALTQHGQIGYMQAWLRDWHLDLTSTRTPMSWMPNSEGSVVNGLMPGMATPEQLAALRQATGKALDIQYLTLMRQHHLGGIHMAQEAQRLAGNDDVKWLAGTMVQSQQGEIKLIDDLLKKAQAS
ncbi:hypothetical protein GCM10010172_21910 [Paractinoplanes ferrugineus]|uniref:DUF305 domain-containing protein n=1 Tax=Paractinoplanes ferrugineus TaxID=113564 RepID=A0A919MAP1_9ACTN|nr:DUF305 domain-containing protein [Actinoplanes ferrugineus]GIE08898.1 hypothetical protein Afe05nite_07380 [Actinoplanes ferrugineus]